ncbi:MAG: hypothetical protein ACKV2Q_18035 [Planctomycetaceae bacterium]
MTKTIKMTISVKGVLKRSAGVCKRSRDNKHLEFPLKHLLLNLNELFRRREEPGILEEFFGVWTVDAMDETPTPTAEAAR